MNSIPVDQNTPQHLDYLAAQRYSYSQAKQYLVAQLVLAVPIPILFAIVIAFNPSVQVWAALYGLVLSIFDAVILDPNQKNLKNQAAKIQELFDCSLFRLPWHKIKLGGKPSPELISELAEKYKQYDPSYGTLRNWYPPIVGQVPLDLARIICQRINLSWDSRLRRRYNFWVGMLIAISVTLIFSIGLIGGLTLEKFVLAVFAPLTPLFLWAIREYRRQHEAAETLDDIRQRVDAVFSEIVRKIISPEQAKSESEQLQDSIFDLRRNNPLIFDWVYRLLLKSFAEQTTKGAKELVEEALAATQQT